MKFLCAELEDLGIGVAARQIAPADIGLEQAEQVAAIGETYLPQHGSGVLEDDATAIG